jgi:hypothetical protein
MPYFFPPRTPQQKGTNEANLDTIEFSDEANIDHSVVFITGEEGIGGGGNLLASRTLYLEFDNLSNKPTPDAADYIAIYDPVAEVHKYILFSTVVAAGGGAVLKYSHNDCMITASDTGVTVTIDSINGIVTVTVPTGVNLFSVNLTLELADTDASNNLYVKIIYEGEGTISQDLTSVDVPHVTYINTSIPIISNGGVPSESYPAPYDPTKNIQLITSELDGADAILQIKIESIVDDNFIVKLSF